MRLRARSTPFSSPSTYSTSPASSRRSAGGDVTHGDPRRTARTDTPVATRRSRSAKVRSMAQSPSRSWCVATGVCVISWGKVSSGVRGGHAGAARSSSLPENRPAITHDQVRQERNDQDSQAGPEEPLGECDRRDADRGVLADHWRRVNASGFPSPRSVASRAAFSPTCRVWSHRPFRRQSFKTVRGKGLR